MAEVPARARRGRGWIVFSVTAAVVIGFAVSIPIVNDVAARDVETRLLDLPIPEGAERIDSMAQAGKLVGNGNGMQYLGALLIRGDDSVGELQRFYGVHGETVGLSITVTPADDLEGFHGAGGFLAHSGEPGTFVVQAWGNGPGEIFEEFDIRGH